MSKRQLCLVFFVVLIAITVTSVTNAQTTFGSIVGAITDSTGSSVPSAQVSLTNLDTSETRRLTTGAEGLYAFVNLRPGRYRLEVQKPGFKHITQEPIRVEVQSTTKIGLVLEVGEVTETVQVTEAAPLLQAETTSLGQVVEQRLTNELPLNGRNPLSLVSLVPSVVPQGQSGQTATGANPHAFGNYQIGGGFANESAAYLDGAPLNTAYVNDVMLVPTQDSIQEFKVQTSNLPPEFGRFAGGVINMTTKSGSNQLHGAAWEFLRNKVLNGSDFFSNAAGIPRPAFTQNEFGLNLGGPVVHDRTFFFFDYEGFRLRQGQTFVDTVPTAAERQGDLSNLRQSNGNVIPIYDPLTTTPDPNNPGAYIRTPFANNMIPFQRISPAAAQLLKFYPLPNAAGNPVTGVNNYVKNASVGGDNDEYVARIDHRFSDKQYLFARYSYWSNLNLPIDPLGTGVCKDRCTEVFNTNSFVLDDSYTFTPTTILDLRASFLRWSYDRTPVVTNYDLTQLGWPAALNKQVSFHSVPTPCISGFDPGNYFCGTGLGSNIFSRDDNERIAGNLTKVMGVHTFRFGGEFLRQTHNYGQDQIAAGLFNFDQNFTSSSPLKPIGGSGLASYLLGYPTASSSSPSSANSVQFPTGEQLYSGLFFGDDWKVTKRLTLNLGIRWERAGPWTERYDQLSYFDPGIPNPIAQKAGLNYKGAIGLVNSSTRGSRYNINPDDRQFSPRFGVAYQITPKTVLRTGYGLFWIPNNLAQSLMPTSDSVNAHATLFVSSIDGGLTPYNTLNNPFPNGLVPPPGRNLVLAQQILLGANVLSPLVNNPFGYAQQWNFNIQRELGNGFLLDVAYAGAKGTHLVCCQGGSVNINQLPDRYLALGNQLLQQVPNPLYGLVTQGPLSAATVQYSQLLRPYPQYAAVSIPSANIGDSSYESLQVKAERRFSNGISILAGYTFSKLMSDTETNSTWLESGGVPPIQNANNLRLERSLSAFSVPHRLVIGYNLDVPVGKGQKYLPNISGFVNQLIGGWGVQGITTLQSGLPLHFTTAQNLTNSFNGGARPNVNVAACPSGASVSGSPESRLNGWFNTACFSQPAAFTFGNESRTDPKLRSNGLTNFDISVYKNFPYSERIGLQFRAEFFNITNTPQFGFPGQVFGTPQFGQVSSQANTPRLIQLALRLKF